MSFTTANNRACANDSASMTTALPPRKLSHQNFVTTLPPTHTGDAHRCEGRPRQKCGARAANRRNPRAISGIAATCGSAATKLDRIWFICNLVIVYGTDFRTSFLSSDGTRTNYSPSSMKPRCGTDESTPGMRVPTWTISAPAPVEFGETDSMMAFARRMCVRCVIAAIRSSVMRPSTSLRHMKSNDVPSLVNNGLAMRGMSGALMSKPTLILRWS
jgi:hypothetical protein